MQGIVYAKLNDFRLSAKVGGSVGLVIGASIFSFLEIAYFLLRLTKITVKHFVM